VGVLAQLAVLAENIFALDLCYEHRLRSFCLLNLLEGKRNLIVAGVTTDVCLVPPALSMRAEGFHIKVTTTFILGNSED
jgi:nicotinamidase-related amidase